MEPYATNSDSKCNLCGYNFVRGDMHIKRSTELTPITCVLLYWLGKSSFRFPAKLFNVSPTTTYQWVHQITERIEETVVLTTS